MKKIFRLIAALAAATVAFSCMEEANPETPETDNNAGTHYEGPMTTLEFSVDELTKTSYDKENGHQWSEGDQIKIIWGTEDDAYVIAEVVDGFVTATVGDVETFYAVYPETTVYELTEGQIYVVFPKTQDGSFKQANIMAAKTTKNDKNFAFRNLTHIFKFTLSENAEYKGFQFMSNSTSSEEKGISILMTGVIPVTFNDDEENPVTLGTPITKEIAGTKYELSSVVQAGDLEAGGTYYVGFHPGSNMNYGFGFKATKTGGVTNWSEGALSTAPVNVSRSTITSIPNLDKAIRDNWFFKENGTGDGSSWENAGGADLLVKLLGDELAPEVKYNKNTNGWRLYGADLHLAAGTYTLPKTIAFQIAVNNKTAVYGGYPTTLEGTSLAGRDASTHKTIISKNGGTRMFSGNGSVLYNWTWDGITFTSTADFTDRGGVLYVNGSTKGTLKFIDCMFENLSTSNTVGGSVFDFNAGTTEFKASLESCTFNNCSAAAANGGAVIVESGSNSTLNFEDCIFTSNSAKNNGGAIHMAKSVRVNISGCTFTSNTAKYGGAISNEISTLIVDGCTFTGNSVGMQGGAICTYDAGLASPYEEVSAGKKASTYVYNSSFDNNKSSNQGAAIKAQGSGYLAVVNSSFSNNVCSNGGGVLRLRYGTGDGVNLWYINNSSNNPKASNKTQYSISNQGSNSYCYNSIILNETVPGGTVIKKFYNTVVGTALYTADGITSETTVTFAEQIGAFTNGVFPVAASSAAATNGMSSEDLATLGAEGSPLMTAMPLFDVTKLTVDQKGNSREGKTVMGAYVGE